MCWKELFVYLAALESGMKPTDTIVDEPVTINGWSPRNANRTHLGAVTLREAFARSINTISAKIGQQLGFSTIADMARRFGISGTISTYPSMVLGTSEVRLLDMTRAFAAVDNRGVSVVPYAIRRVVTADGRQLYRHENSEDRVLVAPWVAAEMTDLLQSAVLSGTGRAAQIGRPVAGKTGTTSSNKDGWFIGFSSGLTTGVWMGRDDAKAVVGLSGGHAPAAAFHDFMIVATANRPVEQFETQVPMPDWQLAPEEEFGAETTDDSGFEPMVDENGYPLPGSNSGFPGDQPGYLPGGSTPNQQTLDNVFGGPSRQPSTTPPGYPPQQQQPPPQQRPADRYPVPPEQRPAPPPPRSTTPPDPLEPRSDGFQ